MNTLLPLYLDACRWWAFGGAFLGVPPLYQAIRNLIRVHNGSIPNYMPSTEKLLLEKSGLMLSLIGTMLGGAFLPFTTRYEWFAAESPIYVMFMSGIWTLWAFSVWAIAAAFSKSRPILLASAVIWGMAVWVACVTTGGV